jgi:hypothetical protein
MKKTFLLILAAAVAAASYGQTKGTARLYAYRQPVAPGTPGGTVDMEGNEVGTGQSARQNNWIYITSTTRIYPSELWINGQPYAVRIQRIAKTPVPNPSPEAQKPLVPKTSQLVWLLTPVPAVEGKQQPRSRGLAAANEVVVVYKSGGKFHYAAAKTFTDLSAAAMQ